MKTFLIKTALPVAVKLFGIKTVLKLGWRYLLYPKLKEYVENNEIEEWDEKALKLINDNISKIIDLL